jgi:hypothetical protein
MLVPMIDSGCCWLLFIFVFHFFPPLTKLPEVESGKSGAQKSKNGFPKPEGRRERELIFLQGCQI